MSPAEKRAQAIDFAVGNVLVDKPDATEDDEWEMRRMAANWYDVTQRLREHGVVFDRKHVDTLLRKTD